jgi:hypothetical protein
MEPLHLAREGQTPDRRPAREDTYLRNVEVWIADVVRADSFASRVIIACRSLGRSPQGIYSTIHQLHAGLHRRI